MPTTEETQLQLENVSWEAIIDSIQQDKCIICIGSGLYHENNVRLEDQISQYLEGFKEQLKIRLYDDGWIHYLPGHNVIQPWVKIKEFYNQPFPTAQRIINKLVQIPFHFYISATPDQKLHKSFNGTPHRFDFYFKNKPYNDAGLEKPTKDNPMVYNILGDVENRESLVLTYDDFYSYLESVISEKSMSPKIRECIEDADNFIFLGLPFDQWYMHLFLRMLKQHKNKTLLKYAPNSYIPEKVQSYCNDQFNITFVPFNEESFVDALLDKCKAINLVREQHTAASVAFPSEQIKNLISDNQIEEAFEIFFASLNPGLGSCKTVYDQLAGLSAQFKHLLERARLNIIKPDDYNTERAQINFGLLQLVNEAEKCAKTR